MRTLLYLAVLPVILIAMYLYNKDKEKEPTNLLVKLFFGGVCSCILVLFVDQFISPYFPLLNDANPQLDLFSLIFNVFIGVALVEEMSKWIMVYFISYKHKEFDEFYDMILYATFVALGFACVENILYVFTYGYTVGIFRALLAVPGHTCDGVFMGYYLGLAKINELNNNKIGKIKNIILSMLVPTILHGIYDYCIFSEVPLLVIVFFIFVVLLYILSIKRVNKVSSSNRKITYKDN